MLFSGIITFSCYNIGEKLRIEGGIMWTKPSYKYRNKFGFVRKTNAYLNEDQQEKLQKALAVENHLYDFALNYLYKTYGKTHIDRKVPTAMKRNYLVSRIKKLFLKKYYGMSRWNFKKLSLSSHNAQLFLVQLIVNFAEYKKELRRNSKSMSIKDRYNYKMNITKDKRGHHKNRKHKSWYRIAGIGFHADNRTIIIDLQPKTPLKVLSMHKIRIPDYGTIYIQGNAYDLCEASNIQQVKLKWQHDNTYQLQLVHVQEKPDFDIRNKDSVGLDWNMTDNVFYHDSNDQSFQLNNVVVQKADKYEKMINRLKAKRDRTGFHIRKLSQKIQRLSAKRSQLLTEAYRKAMPKIVDGHRVIVIEKLSTKDMRKQGKSNAKDRGFNRKLALIKPGELQVVLGNYAWKHGVRVIQVNSYKTSQVEFGTDHIHKHELSERSFPSDDDPSKMIGRDVNAAKNILDWGLHPDHHIKVRLFKKVNPKMVADFM